MRHCVMGNHEVPDEAFGSCRSSCKACRTARYKGRGSKYDKARRIVAKRDRFQVASWNAFFHAARIGGRSFHYAVAAAMVKSSDDEYDKLSKSDIERWFEYDDNRALNKN